ncbi:MAG: prephenate dehydrogenase [Erysipelotrichaceae bacterium]|nr:prephenate dehydrogenase [Erysipelotrichaceae bacterium]
MKHGNTRFLIVGLGLMGGSYAKALSERGYAVDGIDIDSTTIDYALKHGYIQRGGIVNEVSLITDADVIISCVYPRTCVNWILENQKYMKSGAYLSDISGVKANVVEPIQTSLRKDLEFVPAHPMCGRELRGVVYANTEMIKGANFILTPTEKNSEEAVSFFVEFAKELGFGKISRLTCEEHDRMIAYVSQLTHAIAVSLMNASENPQINEYTGDSFRDLTRIAKINEQMWSELFIGNKQNLIREIDAFQMELSSLKQAIEDEDYAELKEKFIQSTQRRIQFDR